MSKTELDFSFRRDISQIRAVGQSTVSSSLPKDFSSCGLSLNNTSRFEEKKVLRKLKEQDLLNRMYPYHYLETKSLNASVTTKNS